MHRKLTWGAPRQQGHCLCELQGSEQCRNPKSDNRKSADLKPRIRGTAPRIIWQTNRLGGLDMTQKLGTFPCISSKCNSEWGEIGQNILPTSYLSYPIISIVPCPVILIPTESQPIFGFFWGILGSGEPAARGQAGPSDSGTDGWMDTLWWTNIAMEHDHRNSGFSH